ncbi:putative response regulator [Bacillus sp. TS-2]|nr:putative response regulator [Bacillus sp. TS-2]
MKIKVLHYICKLIYETYHIPISFIDHHFEVKFIYAANEIATFIVSSIRTELKDRVDFFLSEPTLSKTKDMESYAFIKIKDIYSTGGYIIIGPTVSPHFHSEIANFSFLQREVFQNQTEDQILQYFQMLPRTTNKKILNIVRQLYYMLFHKTLEIADITVIDEDNLHVSHIHEVDPNLTILKRREQSNFPYNFSYEKNMFRYITEGRKEEFMDAFTSLERMGNSGVLSKSSPLRNRKNLAIAAITLGTRAAMEGGLHYEVAYMLSDYYIQNIEDLKSIQSVRAFLIKALSDFADRVKKIKQKRYSKPINMCLNYIYTNLYGNLKLVDISKHVNMHPNYISSLFKKEMGISLSKYIHQSKVDEAKLLLKFTNHSLLKVSTMLHFHDQSYFTKVFKKHTGLTPKRYKLMYFESN